MFYVLADWDLCGDFTLFFSPLQNLFEISFSVVEIFVFFFRFCGKGDKHHFWVCITLAIIPLLILPSSLFAGMTQP